MPKVNQFADDVRGLHLVQSRQHSEVLYFKQAKVKNCSFGKTGKIRTPRK